MRQKRTLMIKLAVTMLFMVPIVLGTPSVQAQSPAGQEYIIQVDDWLSKLADKFYGDIFAYPEIVEATNAKAAEDDSFTVITNPDVIEVGQKLWIPRIQQAGTIAAGNILFEPVIVEPLGIGTVTPNNWDRVEEGALLENVWRAGLFSFVEFTTVPGTNSQLGLAQLLRTTVVALNNGSIGGQLTEEQIGGRNWAIYSRSEGAVTLVAAATVQDKVVYQIRLSAENSQKNDILTTILENLEIIDPTVVQQAITIEAPKTGNSLTNPFELRGTTDQYPFRGLLYYRVLDANGRVVGQDTFEVVGRLGHPSTFAVAGQYNVEIGGPGVVEVAEISAADGTTIAFDSVEVNLEAGPPGYAITIQDPLLFESVSTPVQIRGVTSDRPFEGRLSYRVVDANGNEISSGLFAASEGAVGQPHSFDGFAQYSLGQDGPGRIEVFDVRPADGAIFTIDTVNVWLTAP